MEYLLYVRGICEAHYVRDNIERMNEGAAKKKKKEEMRSNADSTSGTRWEPK